MDRNTPEQNSFLNDELLYNLFKPDVWMVCELLQKVELTDRLSSAELNVVVNVKSVNVPPLLNGNFITSLLYYCTIVLLHNCNI